MIAPTRPSRSIHALLVLCTCAAACGDGHTYVQVTVTSAAPITVTRFEVSLANDGLSARATIDKGAPYMLPPEQSFALQLDGRSGDLAIIVDAERADVADAPALQAKGSVKLVPGGTARVSLPLGPTTADGGAPNDGGSPDDGAPPDLAGSCTDHAQNGDETGVDCGGSCPTKCGEAQGCAVATDCASGFCNTETAKCGPARCLDKIKDGDETDIDCGGASCLPCEPDKLCAQDSDCATGWCFNKSLCGLVSGPPNWIPTTITPISSRTLRATTGSDGNVWFITQKYTDGGGVVAVPVNTYEPTTGTFVLDLTRVPAKRPLAGIAFADGGLYVVGGFSSPDGKLVEVFKNDAWTTAASLVDNRTDASSTLGLDGRIYTVGGNVNTAEAYSPLTGTWAQAGQLTARSYVVAATAGDGSILAIGGGEATAPTALVEKYTADNGSSWKKVGSLATPRSYHTAATGADGRVYTAGGIDGANVLLTTEAYSPGASAWLPAAPIDRAHLLGGAATLPDGRIILLGGTVEGAAYPDTFATYGPVIQWSATKGPAGSSVVLSGGNFAAHAKVTVSFDGSTIGQGSTDDAGALVAPIAFTIPPATAGTHLLRASDHRSRYPVSAVFTVE